VVVCIGANLWNILNSSAAPELFRNKSHLNTGIVFNRIVTLIIPHQLPTLVVYIVARIKSTKIFILIN
jgi:hypothetical protein